MKRKGSNLYSKFAVQDVKDTALMVDHVPETRVAGKRIYARCPQCGAFGKVKGKLKGLLITDKDKIHIAKCFDCGFSFGSAVDAEMYYSKSDFRTALEACASHAGITLETEAAGAKRRTRNENPLSDSFVAHQLAASGLTFEDVMVNTVDKNGEPARISAFQRGSMDKYGYVNLDDDEMLIFYYDLYGKPVLFNAASRGKATLPYVRVRWSNPGLNIAKDGKEIKYQTPLGAQTRFYIPQKIRDAFEQGTPIDTLIIQEGEKKAEKACKHGIWSIGIQGIYNIGNAQQGLMQDLQYIVKACGVKNVVLLFDSDWDRLGSGALEGKAADSRPKQFAKAAIKFRTYVRTLHNVGCDVDIWFGHINGDKEKGIDDLLCGSLQLHEDKFLEDMQRTMLTHDGKGTYADFHKISTLTDFQIMDFWALNSLDSFVERHAEMLKDMEEMKFAGVMYGKTDSGGWEPKSIDGKKLKFWSVEYNDKNKKTIEFNSLGILDFIAANNYRVVHTIDQDRGETTVATVDGQIMTPSSIFDVRRFVFSYIRQSTKDAEIAEKFLKNIARNVTKELVDQLPLLNYVDFYSDPYRQTFCFRNGFVDVSSREMLTDVPGHPVWDSDIICRDFERVPIFSEMSWSAGNGFRLIETAAARECEFLDFIKRTSDYWWRTPEKFDSKEQLRHIVNKMSCIGYLLHSYKDMSGCKAVIAMDARMSEVGKSNGRSGKSLIGMALRQMTEQTVIPGRNINAGDEFLYNGVTPSTRTILFDDVKTNFDFGRLFSDLTSDITVNIKGGRRYSIPFDRAPKIYITTNHAISSDDNSTNARRVLMSFSDYFNIDREPISVYGHNFFQGWDDRQWNLFYNFMLECLQLFFRAKEQEWEGRKSGLIEPPMENLRARQLRQIMGEDFLEWAEDTFNEGADSKLGERTLRLDLFKDIYDSYPNIRKYLTARKFRESMEAFCEFKGWHLNVNKPHKETGQLYEEWKLGHKGSFMGDADKANSKEYMTVSKDGDISPGESSNASASDDPFGEDSPFINYMDPHKN